jgi:hypothetical protein
MVLPSGQKMILGPSNPYIYILNRIIRLQAVVKIMTNNNCYLQINDKKAIKGITEKKKRLAHVPVQTWRGWDPNDLV